MKATEYAALRRQLGFPFVIGFYLGGIRNGGRWTEQDIQNAELWVPAHAKRIGQTYPLLPIYVGKNIPWDQPSAFTEQAGSDDGNDAVSLMQQWGLQGCVCLDIEAQTFSSQPIVTMNYVRGWTAAVEAADAIPAVYGLENFIRACGTLSNTANIWKWSARYLADGSRPQTPGLDPTMQDGWQFATNVAFPGVGGVDLNVFDAAWPFASLVS